VTTLRNHGQSGSSKTYLLLQGPNCYFFSNIAGELQRLGHHVVKVHFCTSDCFFWKHPGALHYREPLENWSHFLENLLIEKKITQIVLYGDRRPYHQIAIEVAKKYDIPVAVTDYGYIRPGFLIFENNGISGRSLFPKDKKTIEQLASCTSELTPPERYHDHFFHKIISLALGNLLNILFAFRYPHYCKPIANNALILGLGFIFQFLKILILNPKTNHSVDQLVGEASQHPYFLYPLQIDMDFQIRTSVHYFDQLIAVREIMSSFAKNSDPQARLVIKIHPLDPGLRPWKELVTAMAYELQISERVYFLYGGSLETLLTHCAGVTTINSTVGLQALCHGKRVKNLDQAIYDIPGLIYSDTLDSFWKSEQPVDLAFCQNIVKVIASTLQIRGAYFNRKGLELAVHDAVIRLDQHKMNYPLE
jgi:capsular polysaccharide export protein